MLILTPKQEGVSLIELMIGLAMLAMLLSAGLPSFSLWIQNTQNRTAAESVLNGLQLARIEAVRRNTRVRFNLTNNSGLIDWTACVSATTTCPTPSAPPDPSTIQSRSSSEGTGNARAGISTGELSEAKFTEAIAGGKDLPAGVTFDGLGRAPGAGVGTKSDITRIDITNASAAKARRMVVTISPAGAIRMCDPGLDPDKNPQACPKEGDS